MPCISATFNPTIGPVISIIVAQPGTLKSAATGQQPKIGFYPLLIDTGADVTCISSQIAADLALRSIGKSQVTVPTGVDSANAHLIDIGVVFGDPTKGADTHVVENLVAIEFRGNTSNYQGLLGRDIICRGLLSVAGWDNRFTFCL